MENKKNEQKTAQILYITIMLVMLIMALAVGLVTVANRRKVPVETPSVTTAQSTARTSAVSEIDHTSPSVTTKKEVPSETAPIKKPAVTTAATNASSERAAVAEIPVEKPPTFIMPTIGDVSKKFSIDALVFSNTMEDYRTHNGIDICANIGDGVMAAADGVVTEIYEHPMMGNTVVVSHEGDVKSVYQNLAEEIAVSVGDTVKCGEIIGAVGDSALIEVAEEPHLHFEMTVGAEYKNPLDYISIETMTVVYEE